MATRKLDPLDLFQTLEAGEGPVLMAIVKPGCGACRMLEGALERLAIPSFLVNAEDGPGLVEAYEIFHFPALFLWVDGEYHARIESAPAMVAIVEAVAAALRLPPEPEP